MKALQRIAVEADDLGQQLVREHRLALVLVLGDDLQQHRTGQVVAGLGVADFELFVVDDQLAHVLQRDVAGDLGVVETTIRVLLDDAGHGQWCRVLRRSTVEAPGMGAAWRSRQAVQVGRCVQRSGFDATATSPCSGHR